jgi:hypothetical protein
MDRETAADARVDRRVDRRASRWRPVKRSEWLVRCAVAFVLLYALVASQTRTDERFPLFGWSLFSDVPQPRGVDYSVRLLELDGERFDPPVYFEDAGIVNQARVVQAVRALRRFGTAAQGDDPNVTAFHADRFQEVYLTEYTSGRYELVRRSFDVRDRYECDCFADEEVIGEFSFG